MASRGSFTSTKCSKVPDPVLDKTSGNLLCLIQVATRNIPQDQHEIVDLAFIVYLHLVGDGLVPQSHDIDEGIQERGGHLCFAKSFRDVSTCGHRGDAGPGTAGKCPMPEPDEVDQIGHPIITDVLQLESGSGEEFVNCPREVSTPAE